MAVGRHTGLRRYAGAVGLISLHIALISQSLLRIHRHVGHIVVRRHMRVLGHAGSVALRREMLVGGFFRRLDLVTTVNTVLVTWSRFGGVQACLVEKSVCIVQ